MGNEFSSGANGQVYLTNGTDVMWSAKDQTLWPKAELRKVESHGIAGTHFGVIYYWHKIASLLFPNNFPEMIGASIRYSTDQLFSRMAPVHPGHAKFTVSCGEGQGGRKSPDRTSETCMEHYRFHQEHNLEARAKELSDEVSPWGIGVPAHDITDYCLSATGDIVFFEVGVYPWKTRNKMKNTDLAPDIRHRLEQYLARLEYHLDEGRKRCSNPGRRPQN